MSALVDLMKRRCEHFLSIFRNAKKIEDGTIPTTGRNENGAIVFDVGEYNPVFVPGTQWRIKTHDATEHGSKYLQTIIGKRFSYPKALYAVHDAINFAIANKRNALILDFSQVAARLCTP